MSRSECERVLSAFVFSSTENHFVFTPHYTSAFNIFLTINWSKTYWRPISSNVGSFISIINYHCLELKHVVKVISLLVLNKSVRKNISISPYTQDIQKYIKLTRLTKIMYRACTMGTYLASIWDKRELSPLKRTNVKNVLKRCISVKLRHSSMSFVFQIYFSYETIIILIR